MWRELGQVRLLHLLEDEEIVCSMLGILYCSSVVAHSLPHADSVASLKDHFSSEVVATLAPTDTAAAATTTAIAATAVTNTLLESDGVEGEYRRTVASDIGDMNTGQAEGTTSITVTYCGVGSDKGAVEAGRKSMVLVSRAILEALSSLRSEGDQMWLIVCIGLNQVAASIFTSCTYKHTQRQGQRQGEGEGEVQGEGQRQGQGERQFDFVLDASQARLLTEVLSERAYADWIVWGVLLAVESLFHTGERRRHSDIEKAANCGDKEGEVEAEGGERGGEVGEGKGEGKGGGRGRGEMTRRHDLEGLKASLLGFRTRREQIGATCAIAAPTAAPTIASAINPSPVPMSVSVSVSVWAFLKDCHVTVTPSGSGALQCVDSTLAALLSLHRPHLIPSRLHS